MRRVFSFTPGKSNKKSKDVRSITRIIVNEKDTNELLITKDIDKRKDQTCKINPAYPYITVPASVFLGQA